MELSGSFCGRLGPRLDERHHPSLVQTQAVEGGRDRLPADEGGREERAEAAQRLALDRSVGRRRGSQLSLQGAFDLAPVRDEPSGEDAIRLHETGV